MLCAGYEVRRSAAELVAGTWQTSLFHFQVNQKHFVFISIFSFTEMLFTLLIICGGNLQLC